VLAITADDPKIEHMPKRNGIFVVFGELHSDVNTGLERVREEVSREDSYL
jgi:hypothetical protein